MYKLANSSFLCRDVYILKMRKFLFTNVWNSKNALHMEILHTKYAYGNLENPWNRGNIQVEIYEKELCKKNNAKSLSDLLLIIKMFKSSKIEVTFCSKL